MSNKTYIDRLKHFKKTKAGYDEALEFLIATGWEFRLINGSATTLAIKVVAPDSLDNYFGLDCDDYTEFIDAENVNSISNLDNTYYKAIDYVFEILDTIYQNKQNEVNQFSNWFLEPDGEKEQS